MEYKVTLDKNSEKAGSGVITGTITAPAGYYGHSVLALLSTNEGSGNTSAKFVDSGTRITKREFQTELTARVEFTSNVAAEGYINVMDTHGDVSSNWAHFKFTS